MSIDYGSDLYCWDDLDPMMSEIPGNDWLVVAQAVYHRLVTPHGSLLDDPNYGLDLSSYLELGMTEKQMSMLPSQIELQVLQDDRIASAACTIVRTGQSTLRISLKCVASESSPFGMTFSLSPTGSSIEELVSG